MITPAARNTQAFLEAREPSLRYGVTNCRKIADTNVWSQHAWSNALDITSSEGVLTLDRVARLLTANKERLAIRVLLWWRKDHYTHIHVDFWPKGYSDPPCWKSSRLVVAHRDGKMGNKFTYSGIIQDKGIEVLSKSDKGTAVKWFQTMLDRAGYVPLPGKLDGEYGLKTEASVKAFQRAFNLPETGTIGDITAVLLGSFSKRWVVDVPSYKRSILDGSIVKLTKIDQ